MSATAAERDVEAGDTEDPSTSDTQGNNLAADNGAVEKEEGQADNDEDEDEEDEEEEPKLKYARLTGSLSSIYRNEDSTSAFTIAGDKMV